MSSLGLRLKEERDRLGLNQHQMGEAGGASKNTQLAYESEKSSPTAKYLLEIANKGADIVYVLTGKRMALHGGVREGSAEYLLTRYNVPADALEAALQVQGDLDLRFNADQLKALIGYAYKHQVGPDELNDFVRVAYAITGRPLEDK